MLFPLLFSDCIIVILLYLYHSSCTSQISGPSFLFACINLTLAPTMLFPHVLFYTAFLLPLTLTTPRPFAEIPVSCSDEPTQRIDISDCKNLMSDMREHKEKYPWANLLRIWGSMQPIPYQTPLILDRQTFRIVIQSRNPHNMDSDVFNVANYLDALDEVLQVCFEVETGNDAGWKAFL